MDLGFNTKTLFGDQSQPGSAFDHFLQAALPPYAIMRNMKAMEDPEKYGPGTTYGTIKNLTDQQPRGLMEMQDMQYSPYTTSPVLGDTGGLFGSGFFSTPAQNNSFEDDMSFVNPDTGDTMSGTSWTSADEQDYADSIGVADY